MSKNKNQKNIEKIIEKIIKLMTGDHMNHVNLLHALHLFANTFKITFKIAFKIKGAAKMTKSFFAKNNAVKKYMSYAAMSIFAMQLTACATKTENPNQKPLSSIANTNANANGTITTALKDPQTTQISDDDSKPKIQTISLAPMPQRMGNEPEPKVIYFTTDSSLLDAPSQEITKKHAAFLANNIANNTPQSVAVQGHTDERGTNEYNLALGQRRAEAVKRAMVLLGARAGDIETTSFGEEKPAMDAQNDEAYGKNRRAEWFYKN